MDLKKSEDFSCKVVAELKRLRLEKQISQNQLAELAGVSRAAIQHIEKQIRNPTLVLLHSISQSLGVSLAEVLETVEKKNR